MQYNRLPVIPQDILRKHNVDDVADTRFKASARLLQSLWRQDMGFPIGTHITQDGKSRKLGSRIDEVCARQGNNFLSPSIAKLAFRESVYREIGALIDEERLWSNLLSSHPLCFNLFGELKLDIEKATLFFRHLFPNFVESVEDILFEHSPGRGSPSFTEDNTAFDVFAICTTTSGARGFVAIEVKYSETMTEPLATLRPRYDELSSSVGVYKDADSSALRQSPIQQFWREHMLSRAMVRQGLYNQGLFVVIFPAQNNNCDSAVQAYHSQLISSDPSVSGFESRTLEECLNALRAIGDAEAALELYNRYLNFERVDQAIFG